MDFRFRSGQILQVVPSDSDDPTANEMAGRRCRFVRYADAPGKLARYAVVQFSTRSHNVYMREGDLQPLDAEVPEEQAA